MINLAVKKAVLEGLSEWQWGTVRASVPQYTGVLDINNSGKMIDGNSEIWCVDTAPDYTEQTGQSFLSACQNAGIALPDACYYEDIPVGWDVYVPDNVEPPEN